MKEERIWILLSRKLAGEISIPEQEELNQILEREAGTEAPGGTGAVWELLKDPELEAVEEEAALDAAGVYWEKQQELLEKDKQLPEERGRIGQFPSIPGRRSWTSWAAAACLAALVVFSVWKNVPPNNFISVQQQAAYVEIITGPKQKKNLTLPDGSQVTLNENSRFRYNKAMSLRHSRSASLSGEAYFEITSNPDAPFVLQTPQMEIKVLGTSFNVRANEGDSISETTLFHGKIEVTLAGEEKDTRTVLLQPEEKLTLKNNRFRIASLRQPDTAWSQTVQYTISEIAKPAGENIYKENAWASSKIVFNDDPLSSVAAFLEKKYGISVVFSDPALLEETRIRGVFRDDSLLSILEALKFTSGFRYTIADTVVTIY